MTNFTPIIERIVDENSPEAKLLRQRLAYLGVICIAIVVVGLMAIVPDFQLDTTKAVIIAVIGFALIIIDRFDTWLGLRSVTAGSVNSEEIASPVTALAPVNATASVPDPPGAVG